MTIGIELISGQTSATVPQLQVLAFNHLYVSQQDRGGGVGEYGDIRWPKPELLPSPPWPIPLCLLSCVAEGCQGGLCKPGVPLPEGDREESQSLEHAEWSRTGPALSRYKSIPWARIPRAEIFWE